MTVAEPRFERRIVGGVALGVVVLHLAFGARYGWFRDELYYVACGRRLAFGYVDHPPIVAVIARLATTLFGGSLVGLRLFAAFAAGLAIVLTAEIARTFGGRRLAQTIAAGASAIAPYYLVVGHVYTMNAFEPLVWGGIGLVVARALRDEDGTASRRGLLWLGPLVGIGILNKHSASWPAIALALGLLASPGRRLLLRKEIWIAAGIATLLVLPHLLWQVKHHFPTLEFGRSALSGKNEPYGPLGLFGQVAQQLHPLLVPLWLAGLVGLLASAGLRRFRPLGIGFVLIALLVYGTQAKTYYLAPAFTWLFAAGAIVAERAVGERLLWRRLLAAYGALAFLGGLALLPMAIPALEALTFIGYARRLGVLGEQRSGEKMRPAALPQLYADMHGWPELAVAVEGVVRGLTPAERDDAVVLALNYGEASAIEHFGGGRVPPVGSGDNGWWLWGPPRSAPAIVIWVGDVDRRRLDVLFDDVREIARADHPLARADERDLPIYVCRGPKTTLADAWPSLKHYR
jgi:hypothetical protein